jgi:hypothetical protein
MTFDVSRIKAERRVVESAGKPVIEEAYLNLTVRAPAELVAKFREAAASNDRSINGQMVFLMRQFLKSEECKP